MNALDQFRSFLEAFHEQFPSGTPLSLKHMRDSQGRSSYHKLAEEALQHAVPSPRTLDLGCGDGTLLAEVSNLSPQSELTGIDLSRADIAIARKRLPSATFYRGDFLGYRFPRESFDCILSHLVLMLAGPLEPVLAFVRHHIAENGVFAFVVDDLNAVPGSFKKLMDVVMQAAAVESATAGFRTTIDRRLYEKDALRAVLSQYDLDLLQFGPHQLSATMSLEQVWEFLLLMYQVGTLSDEQKSRAYAAVSKTVGDNPCEIPLDFQIVIARRFRN